MILFFIFINSVFLMIFALEAPHVFFVIVRVFGGTCVALTTQIFKGFTLYDELLPEELDFGRDSDFLYFTRIFFLGFLVVFTIYLFVSCCCLCCIGGVDGGNLQNVRNPNKLFKRVPFGGLVFQEGLDCAICMEHFHESHRVVQLSCHHSHIFHRSCLTGWVRSGH